MAMVHCPRDSWGPEFGLGICQPYSILDLAPLAIFAVGSSVEVYNLGSKKQRQRESHKLLWCKLGLASIAAGLQVAALLINFVQRRQWDFQTLTDTLRPLASSASLSLHVLTFNRLKRSSTTLLFFWLFSILVDLIKLRYIVRVDTPSLLALSLLAIAAETGVFSLECLGPESGHPPIALPIEDDSVDYSGREAPIEKANVFSRMTFSWLDRLMVQGYKKTLTEVDLWALRREDQADVLGEKLQSFWDEQRALVRAGKKKSPSIWIALAKSYGGPFFVAAVFKVFQDLLAFLQPLLLKRLLAWVDTYRTANPQPASFGYSIAFLMFLSAVVQSFALHQYFSRCFETSMRVRGGLIHLIYKKSLVLSNDERLGRATGDIVNLQSTDATRMADTMQYGQILWSGTFQLILAFVSLYKLLGWYGLVGVAVMILGIPLNSFVARLQTKLHKRQMKNKDQRSRLMNEILNNIRTIKLACWESAFAKKLSAIRNDKELVLLRRLGYWTAASTFLWSYIPFLVAFATFSSYAVWSGRPLTSQVVFPALSLFNLLNFPLAVLPNVITSWVEAFVSARRLVDFLDANELQKDAIIYEPFAEAPLPGTELVTVSNASFAWTTKASDPILSNISLSVKKGELLCVVGRVGAGKSSLLSAVLGEMTRLNGTVKIRGASIAYVPQTAWIMGGSVRDNITFGAKFEPEFYQAVIEACALKEDLAILPHGDMSQVGEKGLSLSGGQKARLTLARALYARADIYLFDDPLSALDSHVGRHVFDRVIGPNGLLASKARMLCTNAIPFVQQADEILMLRAGAIIERGTFASVKGTGSQIAKLLEEYGKQEDDANSTNSKNTLDEKDLELDEEQEKEVTKNILRRSSDAFTRRAVMIDVRTQKFQTFHALKLSSGKTSTEMRETGAVKTRHYWAYIKANGYLGVALYIISIVLTQIFQISSAIWLKNWSQHNSLENGNSRTAFYLAVYFVIGTAQGLTSLANGIILYAMCIIRSAKIMHDSMFDAVMRSPMSFFETTPVGTVLNRFSRDIYVIDEVLARVGGGFFRTFASVVGVVLVITSQVPLYIVVCIPVGILYYRVQTYYLSTSRELKRLDSTTKSPIFASFAETLNGLSTIRAFKQSERFLAENESRLDRNQECFFPSVSCNRWLAVRLELMGAFLILAAAVLSVSALVRGQAIDAGLVGIIISFSLTITGSLNWFVRSATEVETNITSVERCVQYAELKPEAPLHTDVVPRASWPEKGEIHFDHYSARYRPDLDLVLKDIDVHIDPAQKVGIVGRTGSGKSSMLNGLFRIIEAAEGRIIIDGVDTSKIGLYDLRSKMSVIPQDSQCFEGTLRENLDPTGVSSDEELWRALDDSSLKKHAQLMGGLDARVDEGGANLSAGQRQLMCLARALLRHSKILVLDEATSAIDPESDKAVQLVIRRAFSDCTILTVAHRINTIMDSDKVLALEKGRVLEFDKPSVLLETESSTFLSLAREAGATSRSTPIPSRPPSPKPKGNGTTEPGH